MSDFILTGFADEIDESLEIQLKVLKELNIQYMEVRGVNGKNISKHTLQEVKEIKKQLDENGVKVSAIGSPLGKIMITDDFSAHIELTKHIINIAKILNTSYIRIFSFFIKEGENPDLYREEVMKRLKIMVKLAEENNIIMLHENEKDIYGDTAKRCLDIYNSVSSKNLKLIFDPANFVQVSEETYPKAFNILKDYIHYMHIKDAVLINKKVVPSGEGDGKIKEILSDLNSMNYEGFLSLEPHLGSFEGLAALENKEIKDMPDGGAKLFKVAYFALEKILKEM